MKNYSMEEQLKDLKRQNNEIMTQIKEDKEQREEGINLFAYCLIMIAIVWLIFGIGFLATEFLDYMIPEPGFYRLDYEKGLEKVDADKKWIYEKVLTITEK